MDPEENKRNAVSPSPMMPFQEQLIYKLAALDASVQSGFRRLDDRIERMQSDLHDSQINTNDRINRLDTEMQASFLRKRTRLDTLERDHVTHEELRANCIKAETEMHKVEARLGTLEKWQTVVVARAGIVMAIIVFLWTFLSPAIRTLFGMPG